MKLHLLVCLGLFASLEAKKSPVLPPSHPYVTSIELVFNEDNTIEFITDSFFATVHEDHDANKTCNITLYDVLSVLPAADLTPAFNELNITLVGDDVTQLIRGLNYTELAAAGFSAKKTYRNVVDAYFQNGTQDLLTSLNILDVTVEFTTAYAFGTDEELFRAFQKGNFSVYNLQEITALVNTPPEGTSKVLGLKHFNTPYIKGLVNKELTELLVLRGLRKENLRKFLEELELEAGDFKKIKAFKNFYKIHTERESLGVAVSPNEVITNDESIIEDLIDLGKYASLKIKSLQDSKLKYLIGADDVRPEEDGIFTIHIEEGVLNYINKTENFLPKNCTYVTEDAKHRLTARNVSVNTAETKLSIPKLLGTTYKKGGPLICGSLLYGLAEVNNIDSIVFTRVTQRANVAKIDSGALNGLLDLLSNFLQLFDVCSFTDCEPIAGDTLTESQSQNQSENENESQTPEFQEQSQLDAEEKSQAQAQSEIEQQNQTEQEIESRPAVQIQNQSEFEVQNPSEDEENSQSEGQAQTEAQVQLQFQIDLQSQSEIEAQTQSQAEFEGQIQSGDEAKSQPEVQALLVTAEIEDQTQGQNQSQDHSQIDAQAQIQAEFEGQIQSGDEEKSQPKVQTVLVTEEIEDQTQDHFQIEAQAQSQAEFEGQIQSDDEEKSQPDVETVLVTQEIEDQIRGQNQSQDLFQIEAQAQSQGEFEGQIQSDDEEESQPKVQTVLVTKEIEDQTQEQHQSEGHFQIEAQAQSQAEFEGQIQSGDEEKSQPQVQTQSEAEVKTQLENANEIQAGTELQIDLDMKKS